MTQVLTDSSKGIGDDEEQSTLEIERIASNISKVCDGESTLLAAAAMLTLLKASSETLGPVIGRLLLGHIAADLREFSALSLDQPSGLH